MAISVPLRSFSTAVLVALVLLTLPLLASISLHAQSATTAASPAVPAPAATQGDSKTEHTQEDFASLGLASSSLAAAPPIPGGHEENKDFVRDLVRVQWRMGDPIDLYIVRPANVKKSPVVLYILSFPNGSEKFLNADFCRKLTQNGVAAVGFSSALTANRYVRRPMKQWFVSELQESMAATTHDVQMILDYLQTRDDLDLSRVGIFGQGSGGAIAILAAQADPRIKVLDLLEPWGDWPDFLAKTAVIAEEERANYLKPDFLKNLEVVEPARYLPQLRDRTIRIQFAADAPAPHVADTLLKATPASAESHHYASTGELRAATGGKLFQWVGDHTKPESVAQSPSSPSVEKGSSH